MSIGYWNNLQLLRRACTRTIIYAILCLFSPSLSLSAIISELLSLQPICFACVIATWENGDVANGVSHVACLCRLKNLIFTVTLTCSNGHTADILWNEFDWMERMSDFFTFVSFFLIFIYLRRLFCMILMWQIKVIGEIWHCTKFIFTSIIYKASIKTPFFCWNKGVDSIASKLCRVFLQEILKIWTVCTGRYGVGVIQMVSFLDKSSCTVMERRRRNVCTASV